MTAFLITLATFGIFALVIIAAVLRGWALSVLWGWFITPLLNVPPIGIAQAIGLALVVGLLTHQYVPAKDKDTWAPLCAIALTPGLAVLFGWIVKIYM